MKILLELRHLCKIYGIFISDTPKIKFLSPKHLKFLRSFVVLGTFLTICIIVEGYCYLYLSFTDTVRETAYMINKVMVNLFAYILLLVREEHLQETFDSWERFINES